MTGTHVQEVGFVHETVVFLVNTWLKLFFLLTPFFALSMFLSLTKNLPPVRRRRLALQTAGAGAVICLVLFFFGRVVFSLFGITLERLLTVDGLRLPPERVYRKVEVQSLKVLR